MRSGGVFNTSSIRVVTLEGNPWFVGADVLRILFGSTGGKGHCYDRLDSSERCKVKRTHLGSPAGKDMEAVSESGLYKLIMRSDKPQAKAFQDWVTKEVLPSIRKTGSFVTGQPSLEENPKMDPLGDLKLLPS